MQEQILLAVDCNNQFLFRNLADDLGLRYIDFDTGLDYGCGYHENDQQHQNDIDERDHVDLRQCGLRFAFACRDRHK